MNSRHVNWLNRLGMRLRALLKKQELEQELDDELPFHIEMQTEENLRKGMSPAEARRQAVIAFGGLEGHKEACRDARGVRLLEDLAADVRYAARALRRNAGFTVVAVLTLALGLGANSALFGLLHALLFRMPPGIPESDRLTWIGESGLAKVSYADYRDVRASAPSFSGIAAFMPTSLGLGSGGEPVRIPGAMVSANYFEVLGASPVLGRGFLPEEDAAPGVSPVVVIGHDLWERRFNMDPGITGRSVVLNGHPFTVIGVAPRGFVGTDIEDPAELWVPATMQPIAMPRQFDVLGDREFALFRLIGRMREGVEPEQAEAALAVVAKRIDALEAERPSPFRLEVIPFRGWVPVRGLGSMRTIIGFAWILTGLVLVIACANLANLLLARAVGRSREIGIRLALGVGRARLVRLLITEALLLSLVGGALGYITSLLASNWFQTRFRGPLAPLDVSPDGRTLLFTGALAILTGVLFGLVPAWRASRLDVVSAIKAADPTGLRRTRLQGALVVVQVALSLVLLLSAGLFLRKYQEAQNQDLGFDTENVLALSFDLHAQGYSEAAREAFYREVRARSVRLPGVQAASVPAFVPLARGVVLSSVSVAHDDGSSPEGRPPGSAVGVMGIASNHFRALGIPVLRGRDIQEDDLRSSTPIAVVSQSFAQRHLPGGDPIGKQFHLGSRDGDPIEVIGVARDIITEIGGPGRPHLYVPVQQFIGRMAETHLVVRTAGDPTALAATLREEIRQMDPNLPIFDVQTLAQVAEQKLGFQRGLTGVIASFGALALILAALGLYGVIAFTVAGRRREIGVRVALGASRSEVVGLFLRDGLRLTLTGLALGGGLSFAVGRLISSIMAGIRPMDPFALLSVASMLAAVALLSTYLPARRATRIVPMIALRVE